jgi:uncharacterized protein
MSVELRPLGVKCNIQCQYCYQNPQRDAGNILKTYDIEKMKNAAEEEGGGITLFGGEPLMVPEKDLEELWSWGFKKYGGTGIQTNGTLINDNHIEMFKKYNVYVGVSVDGPGELNDVRWHGSLERTRDSTERTHAAIARLVREGIPVSLIITLHRNNATADKLPIMIDWFKYLDSLNGIKSARLHILEVENIAIKEKYALSSEENLAALLSFAELEKNLVNLRLDLFSDMRNLLAGKDDNTTCIWNACDPYTTAAVRGVEGNGQRSNCGRTNKEGIDFTKATQQGFERYLALYHTPQEHGGCGGCRFFLVCKGQCPGTSIDGDWRNRTEHCSVWKSLYRLLEEEMLDRLETPISANPFRRNIEQVFLDHWASGTNTTISRAIEEFGRSAKGSVQSSQSISYHGDVPHGDHTDAHGDS